MTAEEFLKNRKNIHDKTISDREQIMDFWEVAEIMQEYANYKQLTIPVVVGSYSQEEIEAAYDKGLEDGYACMPSNL